MIENIIFPMEYLNITQGYGVGTHVGTYAIDNAGRDSGIDNAFAPFTGTIKKKYANGDTVWLESNNPVQFADGSVDYATVSFTHDNNINDLSIGQVVQQGVNFYQEGTAGQATGNHVHIEIGKGKFTGSGWYQNEDGIWTINNKYKPEDAFFLSGTEIINGGGLPWKEIGEFMSKDEATELALYIRLLAGESVDEANGHSEDDVAHIVADPGYAGAMAKQVYAGEWQPFAYKATHYDADVKAAAGSAKPGQVLAPGSYVVK